MGLAAQILESTLLLLLSISQSFFFLVLCLPRQVRTSNDARGRLGFKTGNNIKITLFDFHPTGPPRQNRKNSEFTLFTHKSHRFLLLPPCRPTGHCPNATIASLPLNDAICHNIRLSPSPFIIQNNNIINYNLLYFMSLCPFF